MTNTLYYPRKNDSSFQRSEIERIFTATDYSSVTFCQADAVPIEDLLHNMLKKHNGEFMFCCKTIIPEVYDCVAKNKVHDKKFALSHSCEDSRILTAVHIEMWVVNGMFTYIKKLRPCPFEYCMIIIEKCLNALKGQLGLILSIAGKKANKNKLRHRLRAYGKVYNSPLKLNSQLSMIVAKYF